MAKKEKQILMMLNLEAQPKLIENALASFLSLIQIKHKNTIIT